MSSLFSIMNVARDALMAQTAGVDISGQNVANANTPGYVRRSAILATRPMGSGTQGGVQFQGIGRATDRFANAHLSTERGRQGAANARADALTHMEAVLAPSSGGIPDRLDAFFSAAHDLASASSDPTSRTALLANAANLAQGVASMAVELADQKGELLSQAQGTAGDVNERLGRIAVLNTQIADATARGEDSADLRDARDVAVGEVAERTGARAVADDKGNIALFAAGSVLVQGDRASSLAVDTDPAGALRFRLTQPGGTVIDVTSHVTDGTLGGLRQVRDTDLAHHAAALDQFAYDLSTAVNAVHRSGVGLDGVGGRDLFVQPTTVAGAAHAMAVDPAVAGNPARIAAASTAADLPGGNDTAVALASVASRPIGASRTPAEHFAAMAADLGTVRAGAEAERSFREDTVAQAKGLVDSTSSVSIDEEMVNLTRFQRAFEASTRVLKTVDELLDGFMQSMR